MKSDMHRKTASKYLKSGLLPDQVKKSTRKGRTRKDPFEGMDEYLKNELRCHPRIEAKTLFEKVLLDYPEKFKMNQLRTFQRKVKELRKDLSQGTEIFFDQEHFPGQVMQLDWTWMKSLEITIRGELFIHKLCHCVLQYSGWECVSICLSESYLSLVQGLQLSFRKLGKVPKILQTDSSSAATHQISRDKQKRALNSDYEELLEHYGIEGRVCNIRKANENGSVESANGHIKRRIEQALILRGSRDFGSQEEYKIFLETVVEEANKPRMSKLNEELACMQDVALIRLPEFQEEQAKVGKNSLVIINKTTYSVPARYIGDTLRFRIYEQYIEAYFKGKQVFVMPRVVNRQACVNYRHIINSLVKKPGAFANYRYREELFPNEIFRQSYDRLQTFFDDEVRIDKEYLGILYLANQEGEERVKGALQDLLLDEPKVFNLFNLRKLLNLVKGIEDANFVVDISTYDKLLGDK